MIILNYVYRYIKMKMTDKDWKRKIEEEFK